MMMNDEQCCKGLVAKIEQHISMSPEVREAFLAIPRAHFVPTYYVQQGQQLIWKQVQATDEVIYDDRALVTQIDARGMPSSSSSLPSVMAAMLEKLDLHPGQHVLEIGTGTGYNAALLAHVVRDDAKVTTIDIDPELTRKVALALKAIGYGRIHICLLNGLEGYSSSAPYDRIIATAGWTSVPDTWIAQLKTKGVLVMNVLCTLSHGIVAIVKHMDGTATGHFLDLPDIAFMQLRDNPSLQPALLSFNFSMYDQQPVLFEEEILPDVFDAAALYNPAFLFFLQWECPQVEKLFSWRGEPTMYLIDRASFTGMTCPQENSSIWTVRVRGQYNLWERVKGAFDVWEQIGRPSLDAYSLDVDQDGQWIQLGKTSSRKRFLWRLPH